MSCKRAPDPGNLSVGMFISPPGTGGFSKVGGKSPPTPNPSGGGETPPEIPPRTGGGGILEFRGGLGGDCQNLKITGLPPGTGGWGLLYRSGGIYHPAAVAHQPLYGFCPTRQNSTTLLRFLTQAEIRWILIYIRLAWVGGRSPKTPVFGRVADGPRHQPAAGRKFWRYYGQQTRWKCAVFIVKTNKYEAKMQKISASGG